MKTKKVFYFSVLSFFLLSFSSPVFAACTSLNDCERSNCSGKVDEELGECLDSCKKECANTTANRSGNTANKNSANSSNTTNPLSTTPTTTTAAGTGTSASGGTGSYNWPSTNLPDPAGGLKQIAENFLKWILGIFGILALISFVISGIQYLVAAGDDEGMKTAKKNMTYSILGVIVGLAGFVIVQAVETALKGSGNF